MRLNKPLSRRLAPKKTKSRPVKTEEWALATNAEGKLVVRNSKTGQELTVVTEENNEK